MSTKIQVTMELPFILRLREPLTALYEKVCRERQVTGLIGHEIQVEFAHDVSVGTFDNPEPQQSRTAVIITVETESSLPEESIGRFAISNCLEIINGAIASYQATTGEALNGGFIFPLGTTHMQLFADIRVNGEDFRDRIPSHSLSTMPLQPHEVDEINRYFKGQQELPLSKLFLTYARLSLEAGQYHVAVLHAAIAVELRLTQYVGAKLRAAGWSDKAREQYEHLPLGRKLEISRTDTRSLETYCHAIDGFTVAYSQVGILLRLRNDVAHRGHLVSHDEALQAFGIAMEFLRVVLGPDD